MLIYLLLKNEKVEGVQINNHSISLEKLNKTTGGRKLYKFLKENQSKVENMTEEIFDLDINTELLQKALNFINDKILYKESFNCYMNEKGEFVDKYFYLNKAGDIGYKKADHKFAGLRKYLSRSKLSISSISKCGKLFEVQYAEYTGTSSRDTVEDCRGFAYFDKKNNLLGDYNIITYNSNPCLALTKDKELVILDKSKPNKPVVVCKGIEFNLHLCHIYRITNKKQLFIFYKNYDGKNDDGEFTTSVFYIYEVEDGQATRVYKQKYIMDEIEIYKKNNKLVVYETCTDKEISFSIKEEIFKKDYLENKLYKKIMYKERKK